MSVSVDFKEFEKYADDMERLSRKELDGFFEDESKKLAATLIAQAISNTPVDTGNLRRNWTGGVDMNPIAYAKTMDVKKVGKAYEITVENPVEYAPYVEYGHRAGSTGFVDGVHMMQTAEDNVNRIAGKTVEQDLVKFLRSKLP